MNERIAKLIEECTDRHFSGGGGFETFDKEKFAQLIVAECATIILNNDIEKQEDYGVNHLFFNGWERGVIDSCQIIKKHFGVE